MKVKLKEKKNKDFKPIKISLTIESEQELCDLWHRLNIDRSDVNEVDTWDLKYEANDYSCAELFRKLDEKAEELELINHE